MEQVKEHVLHLPPSSRKTMNHIRSVHSPTAMWNSVSTHVTPIIERDRNEAHPCCPSLSLTTPILYSISELFLT